MGGVLLVYAGRHLTFFYDEWSFILTRRGGSLDSFLSPHNGHLVAIPVIVYKLLFATVGLRHYTPYRVIAVLLHLLCCALLYALVRPRIGPWLALIPAALLLFMGTSWQILLWPFQMGYLMSVAGGLGALLALERRAARSDVAAGVLLTIAVGSSGVGVAFIVASAVVMLVQRSPRRRFWVVVVPLVLFGIWYLGWSAGESTSSDAILNAPQYVANAAAGAMAGVAGLDLSWGPPLVIGLVFGLVAVWQRRTDRRVTPMLLGAIAGALTFWGLAAVTRADALEPAASRYLYVGAVFILLLIAEVAASRARLGIWSLVALVLLALGAIVSNLHALRAGERGLRSNDVQARAALGAVQLAAPVVPPTFIADPTVLPVVAAGPYLAAVHDLGSPAFTPAQLGHQSEAARTQADGVLARAERLEVAPFAGPLRGTRTLTTTSVNGARLTNRNGCARLVPDPARGDAPITAEVTLRPGSRLLIGSRSGAGGNVLVRRFGATYLSTPIGALNGPTDVISFPADAAASVPWHVLLSPTGPLVMCGA